MIVIATYKKIKGLISTVCHIASMISMMIIFFVMFMLVADILLRLVTKDISLLGTYEITEVAMVVVVFFALAITQLDKGHVHVTMFIDRIPYRAQSFVSGIVSLITTVVCFVAFYTGVLQALDEAKGNVTTAVLFIPLAPFCYIMTFGMLMFALVLIFDTVNYFHRGIMNIPPEGKAGPTALH